MTVTLTPDQVRWLEAKVAAGEFENVDVAAQSMLHDLMAREYGDMAWAKPLVDEARAQIARGEFVTLEEFKRDLAERMKTLRQP